MNSDTICINIYLLYKLKGISNFYRTIKRKSLHEIIP